MITMQYLMMWEKIDSRKDQLEDIAVSAWVTSLERKDPEAFVKALRHLAPNVFKTDKEREMDGIEWVQPQSMEEYQRVLDEFEQTA